MKKFIRLFTIAVTCNLSVHAGPAYRGAIKLSQPDGSVITTYLQGDEIHHQRVTPDGYAILQDAQGYYRYAHQDADNKISIKDAPIVRDAALRTAKDNSYLSTINKANEFTQVTTNAQQIRKVPKATDGTPYNQMRHGNFPTTGDFKGLVILVQFDNLKFTYGHDYMNRLMNEEGFSDNGAIGSTHDYFYDQSNGKFNAKFDVIGPITLPHTYAYYGKNGTDMWGNDAGDKDATKAIYDACQMIDPDVDFSQYDLDGDGQVEMVYVIYAGFGENFGADKNTIWPHKYQLSAMGYNLNCDGVKVDTYACSAELFGYEGNTPCGIGTLCHEFGHVLGLADHYNTSNSSAYQLGRYDIMDYGSYNGDTNTPPSYNAFERLSLGWLTPDIIDEPASNLELENIATSNKAFLLESAKHDEFYLLENRQQTGWDAAIKGSGMMITHLSFEQSHWDSNDINNDDDHRCFYLVCADNDSRYNEYAQKFTEEYDLYPSNDNNSFTDISIPNSQTYQGIGLDRWVTDIKNEEGIVSFNFMQNHYATIKNLYADQIKDTSFRANWSSVDEDAKYEVRLNNLMKASDATIAINEGFKYMTSGSQATPDGTDISSNLDDYTTNNGWTGAKVYQAGGFVKIGAPSVDGSLATPVLNLYNKDRKFTVIVKAHSNIGKTPVFTVSSNGKSGKYRLSSADRIYYYEFDNGLTSTTVTFYVKGESAIIDSILIIRGDASEYTAGAKKISVTGETASNDNPEVEDYFIKTHTEDFTDIETNNFIFNGLDKDCYYSFCVRAVSADGKKNSKWSDETTVFTNAATTSINTTKIDNSNAPIEYFTMDGIKIVKPHQNGLYIRKQGIDSKVFILK